MVQQGDWERRPLRHGNITQNRLWYRSDFHRGQDDFDRWQGRVWDFLPADSVCPGTPGELPHLQGVQCRGPGARAIGENQQYQSQNGPETGPAVDDDLGCKQWHAVVEDEMEMENVGVFNAAFCSLTMKQTMLPKNCSRISYLPIMISSTEVLYWCLPFN